MGASVAPAGRERYVQAMPPPDETDFGYRRVPREDHPALVRSVFDSVAGRYDLMNDLMSLGLHRLWKAALLDWLAPRPGMRLLDVAGGTGDVATAFLDRVKGDGAAVICDANERMLQVGADRAIDRGRLHGILRVCADAAALPLPDRAFDACTIAFSSPCEQRHSSRFFPLSLKLLQRGQPPSLQFFTPRGVPL